MVLLGREGCGKSTLLKCMCGLITLTEGQISIYGKSIRIEQNDIKKMIGYCPQTDILYEYLTAVEQIELICKLKVKNYIN